MADETTPEPITPIVTEPVATPVTEPTSPLTGEENNLTSEPITLTQAQASQLQSTDALNAARGAAAEGRANTAEAVPPAFTPRRFGADTGEAEPDNTFYAKVFEAESATSQIPGTAPNGWLRDTDGGLWDVHSITGLAIEAADAGRYYVKAHTPSGLKTLSSHTAERVRAERHLEHLALHISESRGLIVFEDEAAEEAAEEIVAGKRSRRQKTLEAKDLEATTATV